MWATRPNFSLVFVSLFSLHHPPTLCDGVRLTRPLPVHRGPLPLMGVEGGIINAIILISRRYMYHTRHLLFQASLCVSCFRQLWQTSVSVREVLFAILYRRRNAALRLLLFLQTPMRSTTSFQANPRYFFHGVIW